MNSRVAVEIMGWTACRCLNPNARFSDDFVFQPDDQGKCWCMDVPDRKMQVQHWTAEFTPTTDLNHAKMAWDKLSDEQKDYVYEYMIDLAPHKRQEDNYLDAKVLCEAMLAAKGGGE